MKVREIVRFIGQGYVIDYGEVVEVIEARPDLGTALLAKQGVLLGVYPDSCLERIDEKRLGE